MERIHIISFDVPYPYDYGGVIDVYHRCKALKEFGYYVILHCFEYGRGQHAELLEVANEVHYYKRKSTLFNLLNSLPSIVATRKSNLLLTNLCLNNDDSPIIFEGQHTTLLLNHSHLKNRIKLIRSHNVEHDYYRELAKVETNCLKRIFLKSEARKLKRHQAIFIKANKNLTVSHKDQEYYQNKYKNAHFLPVANPLNWDTSPRKVEPYVLLHGNLSVKENEHAVLWCLEKLNTNKSIQYVIAGKNPAKQLIDKIHSYTNTKLYNTPSNEQLNELIRNAGVNLLITFQNTGIKHKLINALCNGTNVLANTAMVDGTGLSHFCTIANEPKALQKEIKRLLTNPMDEKTISKRTNKIKAIYGLSTHAAQIDKIIKEIKQSST